jgi:hypothetical protein
MEGLHMARADTHDSTTASARVGAYAFLLIDFALFLAAGVLGSFAIACIV